MSRRRKAKNGKLFFVGVLAVILGYLLGSLALNLLLPDSEKTARKQPQVINAEGEEFSQDVASQAEPSQAPTQKEPSGQESQPVMAQESQEDLSAEPEEQPVEVQKSWRVAVGTFASVSQLEETVSELEAAGFEAMPIRSQPYRAQMGVFQDRQRAEALAEQLQAQGFSAQIEEFASGR